MVLHGATQVKKDLNTFYSGGMGGYGYRYGGFGMGGGTAHTSVSEYTVGTLVVDIFDAKSKSLLFRGTATDELSDKAEKNQKKLDKASQKMFKDFPPGVGEEVADWMVSERSGLTWTPHATFRGWSWRSLRIGALTRPFAVDPEAVPAPATTIVVATWPLMLSVQARLWNRRWLAVVVMTGASLLVLIAPLSLAVGAIAINAEAIGEGAWSLRTLQLPPVPAWVEKLPLVGWIAAAWCGGRRPGAGR